MTRYFATSSSSYMYQTPVYHYKQKDSNLISTVNAVDNSLSSIRNATKTQLEKFANGDSNLSMDARPTFSLTLRGLRK